MITPVPGPYPLPRTALDTTALYWLEQYIAADVELGAQLRVTQGDLRRAPYREPMQNADAFIFSIKSRLTTRRHLAQIAVDFCAYVGLVMPHNVPLSSATFGLDRGTIAFIAATLRTQSGVPDMGPAPHHTLAVMDIVARAYRAWPGYTCR